MRIPVRIVELSLLQHPAERQKPKQAKPEADRDKDAENVHSSPYFRRNAFSDTVIELDDIAKAAIRGEHRPATASGTANTL